MELTGKQKRYLRGLGHHRKVSLFIGKGGVSEAVVEEAEQGLEAHELIKIRFGDGFEGKPADAAAAIAEAAGAVVAGRIGRTALLYRPRDEDPEIELPAGAAGEET